MKVHNSEPNPIRLVLWRALCLTLLTGGLFLLLGFLEPQRNLSFQPAPHSAATLERNFSRGVAWGDFDGDDDPDLAVANTQDGPLQVFSNEEGDLLPLEGFPSIPGWHEGIQWVDFDNDGDLDLFSATTEGPSVLLINRGGRVFRKGDLGRLTSLDQESSQGCWGDFDQDGFLDLFLANRNGEDSGIYWNSAGNRFEADASGPWIGNGGDARTCAAGDADGDGDLDLYVGNFLVPGRDDYTKMRDYFYLNEGNRQFREVRIEPFESLRTLTYGLSWIDFDFDGDADLFLTAISRKDQNLLFENQGDLRFRIRSDLTIVSKSRGPSKGHTWGDFDNDADLDLYVANGTEGTERFPDFGIKNFFYSNRGDHLFEWSNVGAPTDDSRISAGVAAADLEGDGDLDLYVANWGGGGEQNNLYLNQANRGHWLRLQLEGSVSPRQPIGAFVRIKTASGPQTRYHLPSTGYGSSNESVLHFGLGDAQRVEEIEVVWPSRERDLFRNFEANRLHHITEGHGPK